MFFHVVGYFVFEFADKYRSLGTGAYDGHIPAQYVYKLRKFIKIGALGTARPDGGLGRGLRGGGLVWPGGGAQALGGDGRAKYRCADTTDYAQIIKDVRYSTA